MICTACYSNFPKSYFGPHLEHLSWMNKIQKMEKMQLEAKKWQRGDGGESVHSQNCCKSTFPCFSIQCAGCCRQRPSCCKFQSDELLVRMSAEANKSEDSTQKVMWKHLQIHRNHHFFSRYNFSISSTFQWLSFLIIS